MSLTMTVEQEVAQVDDQRDPVASEQLFAALYHELYRLAQHALSRDGGDLSISATTLLHEAYLNVSGRAGISFSDPKPFLAYAARAMRGLIIDAMRRRRAMKRGAGFVMTPLDIDHEEDAEDGQVVRHTSDALHLLAADQDFTRLSEALEALAAIDPSLAELVDLKYFCGLSLPEIGALRGVSARTIQREWEQARLLLFESLTDRSTR